MLQGIVRAATAALLFVIAILVYINYFHSSEPVLPEHSELATAPEVPKVPVSIDTPPAAPDVPAAPIADNAPQIPHANACRPRAEILDSGELAEVVELPPLNRARTPMAPAQSPAPKPAGKRTHLVQPGESLWVISRKYLGNGELNAKIAEANGLTSKDHIKAGQLLIIPDLNGSSVAHTPVAPAATSIPAKVSEDLADDDDARHITRVSTPMKSNQPALMSATAPNKY